MNKSSPRTKQQVPLPGVPEAVRSMVHIDALYIDSLDEYVRVEIPNTFEWTLGDQVTLSWTGEDSFDTYTDMKVIDSDEDPLIFWVNAARYVRPYVKRAVTLYYTVQYVAGGGIEKSPSLTLEVSEGSGPGNA